MPVQKRLINWQFSFGLLLLITGSLFLVDQILGTNFMVLYWPLLIVLLGITFLVSVILVGKRGSWLAIPGMVLVTLGLLLFIQNWFNLWVTWAYAWALLISANGIGMLIMNGYYKREGLRRAAGWVVGLGLVLFVFFGVLFEIILNMAGSSVQSSIFLGAGLILLGFFLIFSRALFGSSKTKGATGTADVVDAEYRASEQTSAVDDPQQWVLPEGAEFSSLDFKGAGEVFLLSGEVCDFRVEGDPQLTGKVIVNCEGDQLRVTFSTDIVDWTGLQWINRENRLRYYVTLKQLDQLRLGGAGVILGNGLAGESLTITHAGIGAVNLQGLQYQQLTVSLEGLGEIRLAGQVAEQVADLSGGGNYQADGLLSQEAEVRLTGAGSAQVWVEGKLTAIVSGAGNIHYKGDPQVEETITGLGRVKPV